MSGGLRKPKPLKKKPLPRIQIGRATTTKDLLARLEEEKKKRKNKRK